jgi:hypothetical protein
MEEKSGFELLDEIVKKLDIIDKKLNIILDSNNKPNIAKQESENNSKHVYQKTDLDIAKKEVEKIKSEIKSDGFKNFKFTPSDTSKIKQDVPKGVTGIMAKGRMVANIGGKQTPISNINVKIFDNKDKLIKETKTNRAGLWMSLLPPGKYVALFEGEFNGKKLIPQNRVFIVPEKLPEGQTDIEVF